MRVLLAIGLTLIGIGCERSPGAASAEPRASEPVLDRAALDEAVREVLDEAEPGTELSVWVGPPTGEPWYERDVDVSHPAASAVKTAYLVELFDAYAGRLDEPLEGIDGVLAPTHPAVVHFDAGPVCQNAQGIDELHIFTRLHKRKQVAPLPTTEAFEKP